MSPPVKQKNVVKDYDGDKMISDDDIAKSKEVLELKLRSSKAAENRRIAQFCIGATVVFMLILLHPSIPDTRIMALNGPIETFLFMMASLAGAVIGVTTWFNKKNDTTNP